MNEEEKKIKEIEEKGHEASEEMGELDALEPIGTDDDAESGEATPASVPDEVDDVEENIFPSAE